MNRGLYGVDPARPDAELLVALYRERYGDLATLECERSTPHLRHEAERRKAV